METLLQKETFSKKCDFSIRFLTVLKIPYVWCSVDRTGYESAMYFYDLT